MNFDSPTKHLSLLVLVLANLVPIFGVLFLNWSVFEIVSLYWFENVIIGVFNVVKIALNKPDASINRTSERLSQAAKFFLIPFFTVHYGGFCFVHGVFVHAILGKNAASGSVQGFSGVPQMVMEIFQSGGKWFVFSIIGSHLFSLIVNYIGKGEYRRTTSEELMSAPYGRIMVLHLAIIFGGMAVTAVGSPVGLLLLLIVGKAILDAGLHLRSHRKFESKRRAGKK